MFEFKPIASSSSGNCHYLKTDSASGLLDVGIQWRRIQKAIEFKASGLDFVLTTHQHLDHSRHIKAAINAGVDVYAIQEVWDSIGIKNSHRAHTITPMKSFQIKTLTILPFPVPHDVKNVGFLIADDGGNKMLYLTDCYYSPFKFIGLTHLAIECNHSYDILEQNVANGTLDVGMKNRLIQSHFSLENVKKFLEVNDLSKVQEIHLIHLSTQNSDAERFKREVMELAGKPVYVAGSQ